MSWESLVVSFGANSPLLTHFNVANKIHGTDAFLLFALCLALDQVCKDGGGKAWGSVCCVKLWVSSSDVTLFRTRLHMDLVSSCRNAAVTSTGLVCVDQEGHF